ncbi:MAG: transporter [Muribaculaceae bacterium]|nr:transporter [Muribaculaceae bacterium]
MKISAFQQRLKPWMLPISMLLGIVLHNYIGYVAFLSKYLIFIMLLITYCRIRLSDFRIGPYIWWLLAVQIAGSLAIYFALLPAGNIIAMGGFLCVFCPTATAAPVVAGMLGGSVSRVATYSLFSHTAVAVLAPVLLTWMSGASAETTHISFSTSLVSIATTVLPLILGPLAIALLLRRFSPKTHSGIASHQGLSFYIWAFALLIVVGNSVSFILKEPASMIPEIILLAIVSGAACLLQFYIGRKIGSHYGDPVSGAQSLGQKNTVLAVWLALSYLNPIVSVAPAAYVAWHNTVNSLQIFRHEKQAREHKP